MRLDGQIAARCVGALGGVCGWCGGGERVAGDGSAQLGDGRVPGELGDRGLVGDGDVAGQDGDLVQGQLPGRAKRLPAVMSPPTLCTSDIQNAKMLYQDHVCSP
ncbi:hypothetical protein ASC58_20055 [Phycicoccus sp. Root101]|nr:hypothetical protein ASC58_20055 [Phycicoccus sp. Root101]